MKPGEFNVVRLFRGPEPGTLQEISESAVSFWRNQITKGMLCGLRQEFFSILTVGRPNEIVACSIFVFDAETSLEIDPATFFKSALSFGMSGIVVIRNDPGNCTEPRPFDRLVLKELRKAGELVGVEVCDYIVLGEATAVSLRRAGYFDTPEPPAVPEGND